MGIGNIMKAARNLLAVLAVAAPASANEPGPVLADPTRPGIEEGMNYGIGGFVLQSTLVSPTRKVAVINGQALTVGETVGRAVVTDIRPYEVILNNAGREIHLRISPKLEKERKVKGNDSHEVTE